MEKKVAVLLAGLFVAPVYAQQNVSIYGSVDALYSHWSNDKLPVVQSDDQSGFTGKASRIGFKGEEDLGNGVKAFFLIEQRLAIDTGTLRSQAYDVSWVGLKGGFGETIFGYVPTALDSIASGSWIGNLDTIADFGSRKSKSAKRLTNGLRYISPGFGGVKVLAHYASPEAAGVTTPYGVAVSGTWGNANVDAGWQRDAIWKTWVLSGAYNFGVVKLGAVYSRSADYGWQLLVDGKGRQTRYAIGGTMPVSSGIVGANIGRGSETTTAGEKVNGFTHIGVTYQHNLSKRTQIVTALAYESQKDKWKDSSDKRWGVQLGLRHAF